MPSWNIKITGVAPLLDAWQEGDDPPNEGVIHAVKEGVGYAEGDDPELDEALANLEDASSRDAFNEALSELYDWADRARVWIDPLD